MLDSSSVTNKLAMKVRGKFSPILIFSLGVGGGENQSQSCLTTRQGKRRLYPYLLGFVQERTQQVCIYMDSPQGMEDIACGTMSLISVTQTRRCSGLGKIVADVIAKGDPTRLSSMGVQSPK